MTTGSRPTTAPALRPGAPRRAWLAWLVAPACLAAVLAAAALVLRGPDGLFGVALTALLGLGFLWIAVSVFSPAKADRRCPSCGALALERLDAGTTRGLRCAACGWTDAAASSFYLAEEEGPLETIVLRERAERRARGSRSA